MYVLSSDSLSFPSLGDGGAFLVAAYLVGVRPFEL